MSGYDPRVTSDVPSGGSSEIKSVLIRSITTTTSSSVSTFSDAGPIELIFELVIG